MSSPGSCIHNVSVGRHKNEFIRLLTSNSVNKIHGLAAYSSLFFPSSLCPSTSTSRVLPPSLFTPPPCPPSSAGLAQRHPADPAASSVAAAHPHLSPARHCHPRLHEQHAASRQLEVNDTAPFIAPALVAYVCGFSNPPFRRTAISAG